MNSAELRKKLKKLGCEFTTQGKGGHYSARLNGRMTTIPSHGSEKELGTGLVEAIRKQLGITKVQWARGKKR